VVFGNLNQTPLPAQNGVFERQVLLIQQMTELSDLLWVNPVQPTKILHSREFVQAWPAGVAIRVGIDGRKPEHFHGNQV
jgi:hypothetical protein